jgi:hypothetical protein
MVEKSMCIDCKKKTDYYIYGYCPRCFYKIISPVIEADIKQRQLKKQADSHKISICEDCKIQIVCAIKTLGKKECDLYTPETKSIEPDMLLKDLEDKLRILFQDSRNCHLNWVMDDIKEWLPSYDQLIASRVVKEFSDKVITELHEMRRSTTSMLRINTLHDVGCRIMAIVEEQK